MASSLQREAANIYWTFNIKYHFVTSIIIFFMRSGFNIT